MQSRKIAGVEAKRHEARVGASGGHGVDTLVAESREVMNIREASQYLGVSPDTLYRYIYEAQIPAFKLGNRWKFKKTVLDRWMEKKISTSSGTKSRKK